MRRAFVTPSSEDGQDIAEYAVMVAVILLTILGTIQAYRVERYAHDEHARHSSPVEQQESSTLDLLFGGSRPAISTSSWPSSPSNTGPSVTP